MLNNEVITTDQGILMGIFGLGMQLFIPPRDRTAMRGDLFRVQSDYLRSFRAFLTRHRSVSEDVPDGWIAELSEDPLPAVEASAGAWPIHRAYSNVIFGPCDHPQLQGQDRITRWQSHFLVAPERAQELSAYSCFVPASNELGQDMSFVLRDKLLQWCETLKPAHGLGGYSVVLEMGSTTAERYAYATVQRYPGLDLGEAGVFCARAKETHNRIKSVNWLTVLGDAVLAELGGLNNARAALEPDCTLHPYEGGVVIQAGDVPRLGDTHQGEIPDAYRKVARFTKPVRFGAYRSSLFRVFAPMDGKEEALRWAGRFD